jgi:16S rRNA (adenine1518-N6/adenine1519-N6)-dimethyltransferase
MARSGGSLLGLTRKQLHQLGLQAEKGLGQHFLIDEKALERIVSAADLTPKDIVIEVGAGLGMLTRELAQRAGWVVAIEVDAKLASALKGLLCPLANITVVPVDVLETDPVTLIGLAPDTFDRKYKVVANLPYYIASAVLRHFLEASLKPGLMVVTVQKEVAQAMVARPGKMSILSVSVQLYGKASIVTYVPPQSFYPAPKVSSAVVRIEPYQHPAVDVDIPCFFEVVRGGFAAPRKQLRNSLAQGLNITPEEAARLLAGAGIEQSRRAQTLTLEEWASLCREFTAIAYNK